MRFRFLGDVDCPDWLLAEIYNLSQMTPTNIKNLGQLIASSIIEGDLNDEQIEQFTKDSKTEKKAMVAALEMIFTSSTRNSVSPVDLNSELQQLGLPREHSTALTRIYKDHFLQTSTMLTGQSLRLSRLESIQVVNDDKSSPLKQVNLKIKTCGNKIDETTINFPRDKLDQLLKEMKNVRSLMEQVIQ